MKKIPVKSALTVALFGTPFLWVGMFSWFNIPEFVAYMVGVPLSMICANAWMYFMVYRPYGRKAVG